MSARLSRRTLLAGAAALPTLAMLGCEYDRTTADPINTVDTLDFANRLRIPALAHSEVDAGGVRVFQLSAIAGSAEFLPGVATPTWGYTDGRYGARLSRSDLAGGAGRARPRRDRESAIRDHHGALAWHAPSRTQRRWPAPAHRSRSAMAAGVVDRAAGGNPVVSPASARRDRGTDDSWADRLVLSRRRQQSRAAAEYGIDDIPIILQDRSFDSRGRFLLRDRAVTGLLGDTILVNGTYNPHLPVMSRRVRLRILNASTARIYHLAFADEREFAAHCH